ncbi:MAG: penicillin-binding protein 2 [Rhizobiales bacterium]|nr:penicillin-binding protein 2 [Hyphomicrobiales bacterium]
MDADALTVPTAPAAAPAEPWRRRAMRTLLYGRNVDRDAKARARVGLAILAFAVVYAVIAARLVMFAVAPESHFTRRSVTKDAVATARPDILDRNGLILATDVRAPSLFAEPRKIIDVDEATELLTAVLGLPGVGFLSENKRVYPNRAEVSHLIGLVNIDNQGIAGMEKWVDGHGLQALHMAGLATDRLQKPIELAVDLRVQHALRDELIFAATKYKVKAAAGLVSDVNTGEIVAMVSLPDFDPNDPKQANDPTRINRLTTGVFELGSTFKALTIAMALDAGRITLNSSFDARVPLRYGRFTIHDYHAQRRFLTVPEIFTYSSNIGTARIALAMGVERHKAFLKKMGQLDRLRTELPESAEPLVPKHWGELNTVTIAFGHGLSVAPLQAVEGINALVNGGLLIPPTFLRRTREQALALAKQVVKPETSIKMRYLMRLNAEKGSARKANVEGYYVGGKTGTSEKVVNGRYSKTKVLNTLTAILPADHPRYQVLIMLDEPQALPETHGFTTSGWNAVPTAGRVINRIAPMLGIPPRFDLPPADQLILAKLRQ